jgi:hypothetical protein
MDTTGRLNHLFFPELKIGVMHDVGNVPFLGLVTRIMVSSCDLCMILENATAEGEPRLALLTTTKSIDAISTMPS